MTGGSDAPRETPAAVREFHASVHHLRAPDPVAAAERVRREIGADVATDPATAEALVRARVEAGRDALGGDPQADAEVLARRDAIRAAAAVPPAISNADVAELRRLADDLGRAARIRERTEARFTELLQARVAASTGLTLHPTAVRDAADAVADAEDALASATAAVEALGPDPGEDVADFGAPPASTERGSSVFEAEAFTHGDLAHAHIDPVLQRPHDVFDEGRLEARRSRTRAAAVWIVAIGGAVALIGLDVEPAAAIAVLGLGLVLALFELWRGRRARRAVAAAESAAESAAEADLLASVGAAIDSTASGRAAAALVSEPNRRVVWLSWVVTLDATRDEAEERLRVALNRWHQLTGPTADPHDVEAVVRAHDPQLAYTDRAAESSPTVRTVAAFHRKAQARWKVLWAALGREETPEPEELDAILDELLGDHRRAAADARVLAEVEARVAAAAAVQRPLVLAAPSRWLGPGQLTQLLASVPPEGRVVVIEEQIDGGPAIEAGPDQGDAGEASGWG